jgi:hypothetical protein
MHYENPDRDVCPKGCDPSKSPRGGKSAKSVIRNPAKARKNTAPRGKQGKHK